MIQTETNIAFCPGKFHHCAVQEAPEVAHCFQRTRRKTVWQSLEISIIKISLPRLIASTKGEKPIKILELVNRSSRIRMAQVE